MNKKIATIIYSETFAMYWGVYCIISSFASVYLLESGYSNTEIGVVLAVGNGISVLLQPFVANLTDRSHQVTVLDVLIIMTATIIVFELCTLLLNGKNHLVFITYALMIAFHTSLQPFLNSLSMKFEDVGVHADYGISRGIGSLGYSLMSAILGNIVLIVGVKILPLTGELLLILMLLGMIVLRHIYKHPEKYRNKEVMFAANLDRNNITIGQFLRGHVVFLVISVGILIIFYHQQIVNLFMLQIFQSVGGDSLDMGMYYSLMSLLEIPALLGFSWINKKFSSVSLLKLAVIGLVLRGLLMYTAASPLALQLSLIVHPIGFPLFLGAIVKYINEIMDTGEAVRGQSMYVIAITVSAIVASFTGGILLDGIGAKKMLFLCLLLCIIGAAIILPLVDKAAKESGK